MHVNIDTRYDSPGNETLRRDVVLQWDVSIKESAVVCFTRRLILPMLLQIVGFCLVVGRMYQMPKGGGGQINFLFGISVRPNGPNRGAF